MGLDNHFYSSDHELKTSDDGVTIIASQADALTHIGALRKEWEVHEFIAQDYLVCDGSDVFGFNGIYYDITHLIPELIRSFNDDECEYMFSLFKDILWELAQGKRIIYSGDF